MQITAKSLLFALLATPALCLVLQRDAPDAGQVCDLSSELSQSFVLTDDATIDGPSTDVEEPVKTDKTSAKAESASKELQENKAAFKDAKKVYSEKKEQFQSAQAELMAAMEAMLEVPAADEKMLQLFEDGKAKKDVLLVFYATWCPHCQTFVLHDGKGDPSKAPLEVFNRELQKSDKGVSVMRVNVPDHMKALRESKVFKIQGIPSVFFVNQAGQIHQFQGNPHKLDDLHKFVDEKKDAFIY